MANNDKNKTTDDKKTTLGIIFGGVSSEHDVSCISALSIIKNLDYSRFNVVLIGITKFGRWFIFNDDPELLKNDLWTRSSWITPAQISPDTLVHGLVTAKGEIVRLDVVFPVLHGKNGEDGTIQGLLQLAGIPYVGCNAASSALCMDKAFTNSILDNCNIPQAKWLSVNGDEFFNDSLSNIEKIEKELGYPVFVKPANAGSSIGISKATNRDGLIQSVMTALNEDKKVIFEEYINGREIECAVMGNGSPIISEVGEIITASEFYDYNAKYNNPSSQLHIPARLSENTINLIKEYALKAYKALGCEGMARVDFFVRKSDDSVLLNEVNTIPGQTPISMYPKLFEASGIPYSRLINKLVDYALERGVKY